jgi:nucleoid-associated protein YgaU
MSMFDFIKSTGKKVIRRRPGRPARERTKSINKYIHELGLLQNDVEAFVKGDKVVLKGSIDSDKEKDRLICALGNIEGIGHVDCQLKVKHPEWATTPERKQFYTVQRGDSLPEIAKSLYGDESKYPIIYEANKPMLKHPDRIYPGQVLVIPPEEESQQRKAS